ncbi:MAG: cysteine desulfurase [Candidatus Caenarcaniphilales bacterium]|nr:cysteine desulfurase [Candidatus Caenarcaniphilales bacterium]
MNVLDAKKFREDFPILSREVNGKRIVYLDNGATTQKPKQVIDKITNYYSSENSTVRRGLYYLSENSTYAFDNVRKTVANFINAESEEEIIFTKGCTDGINLIARSFGGKFLQAGDEVLISVLEHHANIVPWQMICEERGAHLKVVPINQKGEIILEELEKLITDKTKILAISHISNVLGTINPIEKIVEIAHGKNVPVLIDGAQGAPHTKVDVQSIGCDFYTFSSHKIYGPTGVGVLYGKLKWLEAIPPYQGGGDMIDKVSFEKTTFAPPPVKFEAGTPPIAQVIGMEEAIKYIQNIGINKIEAYENELLEYATERLLNIDGLRIIGNADEKASLISFLMDDAHAHDIGTILDHENNICIRVGHHCAQPLMKFYGVSATARASFSFYNTKEDIDLLVDGLNKVKELFAV